MILSHEEGRKAGKEPLLPAFLPFSFKKSRAQVFLCGMAVTGFPDMR
jgi:hypothetical protein